MSTQINLEKLYDNSIKILSDLIGFKTISGDDNSKLISKEQRIIKIKPQEIRVEEYELTDRITPKVEDGQEVEVDQVILMDKKDKVRTKLDGVIKLTDKSITSKPLVTKLNSIGLQHTSQSSIKF